MDLKIQISIGFCVKPYGILKVSPTKPSREPSSLSWYMKLFQGLAQPKPLNKIKNLLIVEFKKPKSESQCITELKEIKEKVEEPVWEFDQRFKTLIGRLTFQIPDE
jgi:hypothetical protein